jgi:hypothetical protein
MAQLVRIRLWIRMKWTRKQDRLPAELQDTAERLRDQRPSPTALELDEIKLRAIRQASSRQGKGMMMRSKLISVGLAIGALTTGGTAAVIAGGQGGGDGNGGKGEYKPGCGPKKSDGVNPSGTHTGPPGHGDTNRTHCPKQSHKSNKQSHGGGSHQSHGGGQKGGGHNSHGGGHKGGSHGKK